MVYYYLYCYKEKESYSGMYCSHCIVRECTLVNEINSNLYKKLEIPCISIQPFTIYQVLLLHKRAFNPLGMCFHDDEQRKNFS